MADMRQLRFEQSFERLVLEPTDRLGPWHDFTDAELAPRPPWSPLDRHAVGRSVKALIPSEWVGKDEPILPSDVVHAIASESSDEWTRSEALQRASLWDFPGVVKAILAHEELPSLFHVAKLRRPPSDVFDEVASIVEAYVATLDEPSIHELFELAEWYQTPYLLCRTADATTEYGLHELTDAWLNLRDPEAFRHIAGRMKETQQWPRESNVVSWVANFGCDDVQGLFDLVLRSDPREYDPATYGAAFRVRHPAWVEVLYPIADRPRARQLVEFYLQNEGINAIDGLLQNSVRRGNRRLWAIDWLGRLAADPAQRRRILERLPHHPDVPEEIHALVAQLGQSAAPDWLQHPQGCAPAAFDMTVLPVAHVTDGTVLGSAEVAQAILAGVELKSRVTNIEQVAHELIRRRWYAHADAEVLRDWLALNLTDEIAFQLALSVTTSTGWPNDNDVRARALAFVASLDHAAARWALDRASRAQSRWLRDAAREHVQEICRRRGWGAEQFADRAVPHFRLDPLGGRAFDYGGRVLRMKISGRNDVVFVDGDRELSRLPPARSTDDSHRVRQHKDEWKRIGPVLRDEFGRQADRFTLAMTTRRTWSAEQLRADVLAHPILGQIARRLVWTRVEKGEVQCLLSVDGDAFDVDYGHVGTNSGRWRVAHPVVIDAPAWIEVLAESRIIQPFEQVGRAGAAAFPKGGQVLAYILADRMTEAWQLVPQLSGRRCDLRLESDDGRSVTIGLKPGLVPAFTGRFSSAQEVVVEFDGLRWEGEPLPELEDEANRLLWRCRRQEKDE